MRNELFSNSCILRQCSIPEFHGTDGVSSPNSDGINQFVQQWHDMPAVLERVTHSSVWNVLSEGHCLYGWCIVSFPQGRWLRTGEGATAYRTINSSINSSLTHAKKLMKQFQFTLKWLLTS